MNNLPLFPKPKDMKPKPVAIRVLKDGAEHCNLLTKEGREIYLGRTRTMRDRQGGICCLKGYIASCPGKLNLRDVTFDHEVPRGHGGGARDDRIEVPDPKTGKMLRQNGAAHAQCNYLKGSRRIRYNDAYNQMIKHLGGNHGNNRNHH